MLKKLFVTAAAAAAVSVPLAGAAWAEPSDDPGSNGNGIPAKIGSFLNEPDNYPGVTYGGTTVNGQPIPPGHGFSVFAKVPEQNVPDAYGDQLSDFYNTYGLPGDGVAPGPLPPGTVKFDPTVPGSAVKLFTPGCVNGKGPRPTATVNGVTVSAVCQLAGAHTSKVIRAARIPFQGVRAVPGKGQYCAVEDLTRVIRADDAAAARCHACAIRNT